MKKPARKALPAFLTLSLIFSLITPFADASEDIYNRIKTLSAQGRYAEALTMVQDWIESSPRDPAATSYGMSQWVDLAKVYPPARRALNEMLASLEQVARENPEAAEPFMRVMSLYRSLGMTARQLSLFRELRPYQSAIASEIGCIQMLDTLLALELWEEASDCVPDAILEFENARNALERDLSDFRLEANLFGPDTQIERFNQKMELLVQMLTANERHGDLLELRRRLDSYRQFLP